MTTYTLLMDHIIDRIPSHVLVMQGDNMQAMVKSMELWYIKHQ